LRRLFRTVDEAVAAPDRGKDNCHLQDERQEFACKAGYRSAGRQASLKPVVQNPGTTSPKTTSSSQSSLNDQSEKVGLE
jgi:hypothetical protein